MNWKIYNPDGKEYGFECLYRINDRKLQVASFGANSPSDWFYCIAGAFFKPKKVVLLDLYTGKHITYRFHRKWYYWSFKFFFEIRNLDFDEIEFLGHSMGGVINDIIVFLLQHKKHMLILSDDNKKYGSPKPCREGTIPGINYYNRGDFIPFLPPWYKSNNREMLNKKWRPVWIAHDDYEWGFKE